MTVPAWADDAPRLTPGPQTTVFVEPVRDDGTIDYRAAINARRRQEVPAEHNAFLDLARLMPPHRWPDIEQRRRTFEALGVAVAPLETPYVSLEDFAALRDGKPVRNKSPDEALDDFLETFDADTEPTDATPSFVEHFAAAMDAPWARQTHSLIADWLDANAETFERLEAASHRRGYFAPYTSDGSLFDQMMQELGFARDLARMLAARAQLRIGEGDLDGAWEDLLTLKRFGRLMQQSGPIITRLVGMSLYHLAHGVIADLLTRDDLTHQLAGRMIEDMATLMPQPWLADAIDQDERWVTLDALMRLLIQPHDAQANPFSDMEEGRIGPLLAAARGFDMDPLLRDINEHYDQIIEILRSDVPLENKLQRLGEDAAELKQNFWTLLTLLNARLQAAGEPMPPEMFNEQLRRLLSMLVRTMMFPSCKGPCRVIARHQLMHRVEVTAMALAAYHARIGRYPDMLDDLVPDDLPHIPRDADDEPLRYIRDGHSATVYSIGPDSIDRGDEAESTDDITLQLRGLADSARRDEP
jgi:hypothetical protein